MLLIGLLAFSAAIAAESQEQIIARTYDDWVAATNEKDIEKWSAFLADDPYFSPADTSPLTSRQEVLDYYLKLFADPAFSLDCKQREVHVSRSGDMAWSRGVCQGTSTGPGGSIVSGSSRWFKVWTRQPDESWKCRVNSWKFDGGS